MAGKRRKAPDSRKHAQQLEERFDSRVAERTKTVMVCFKKYIVMAIQAFMNPFVRPDHFKNAFLFFPTGVAMTIEDSSSTQSAAPFLGKDLLMVNEEMWSHLELMQRAQNDTFCQTVKTLMMSELIPETTENIDIIFFSLQCYWQAELGMAEVSTEGHVRRCPDFYARCEVRVADPERVYKTDEVDDLSQYWLFIDDRQVVYQTWIPPAYRIWPLYEAAMDLYFSNRARRQAAKETAPVDSPQVTTPSPAHPQPTLMSQQPQTQLPSPSSGADVPPQLTPAPLQPHPPTVTPASSFSSASSLKVQLESFKSAVEQVSSRMTVIKSTLEALQTGMWSLLSELNAVAEITATAPVTHSGSELDSDDWKSGGTTERKGRQ